MALTRAAIHRCHPSTHSVSVQSGLPSDPSIHLRPVTFIHPAPNSKSVYPGFALRRDACRSCHPSSEEIPSLNRLSSPTAFDARPLTSRRRAQ
ncbi:hypothetical protein LZ31DRAFT_558721 [Colletotrichum somersetense]|nr:hypothetical protein LZ31DRAFT_558721 [Colletotrichum somersetense]